MRKIKLTQNKYALVDETIFDVLNKNKWFAVKSGNTYYAGRNLKVDGGKQKTVLMHSFIVTAKKGLDIDHIDGNGLNNQKYNLRVCTRSQNLMNQGKQKSNTSGFKGVSWHKGHKKWGARIYYNGKNNQLGYFNDKIDAYEAYCNACVKYHGEFRKVI